MIDYKIELKDAYKGYTYDLDKLVHPKETIALFKERLKQKELSVLEKTVRIDSGRIGIPVYFSICGKDAAQTIGKKRHMGKGGTPEQAEASAIMELAERFSLFSFIKKDLPKHCYDEIKEDAIPFEYLARSVHDFSDSYRLISIFSKIPLRWCKAYNFTQKRAYLIPIDWFFQINQYNGSSAGNCPEEAILQGMCEVIERHVSAIVSERKIRTASVDVSDLKDPLARELLEKYKNAGIRLYINDFSLDTGIPTISVVAYDPSTFPDLSEIVWTAGTTTRPEKSLIRALTEVAQLAGDFNSGTRYMPSGLPKPKSLDEIGFVINADKTVKISDLPDISDRNMKTEIENAIEVLRKGQLNVIAVDITHPVLRIPAFYVIIPGCHFRERAKRSDFGMFLVKLVVENENPSFALDVIDQVEKAISERYYLSFFKAMIFMKKGEVEKAISYFSRSLELNPEKQDIPTIYSYMAHCMKDKGEYKKAIELLEKAEEFDSERPDIYNLMGFCYFKLKEHKKAIKCFEKAIQIDPSSAIDYANIGINYKEIGENMKALLYLKIALELDPDIGFAKSALKEILDNLS